MKPKYKYKKVRVKLYFSYDNTDGRVKKGYAISLGYNSNHYYEQILGKNAKYIYKCKFSKSFNKLKKSKLIKKSKVFKPDIYVAVY